MVSDLVAAVISRRGRQHQIGYAGAAASCSSTQTRHGGSVTTRGRTRRSSAVEEAGSRDRCAWLASLGGTLGPATHPGRLTMFVQVIQGRTSQPQALVEAFDRWEADLSPGATGWLGSTGGVTEDGRFIAVARFESEEAAMANSARPEQDAWWSETAKLLDGGATFSNSTDVDVDVHGDPDQAGFVQVMKGRGSDPERAKQLMAQDADRWAEFRPDVIGSVAVGHDEGAYTMVMYFT